MTNTYFKTILWAGLSLTALTSCVKEDDYSIPPINCTDKFAATNHTLTELAALAKDKPAQADIIKEDYIVEGYVSSSDASGNIYKVLYVQDKPEKPTKAIEVQIDGSNNYLDFPIGAKVRINAKGLIVQEGLSGGAKTGNIKLGIYDAAYSVGRINPSRLSSYMSRTCASDGLPAKAVMVPLVFNSFAEAMKPANVNMLATIKNVQFKADELTKNFTDATSTSASDRGLEDATGSSIIIRNSIFATFSNSPISPNYKGSGDVTLILSRFNATYQGYIRDLNDLSFKADRFTINVETFESYTNSVDNFLPKYQNLSLEGSKKWYVQTFSNNKYIQISGLNAGVTKTHFAIPVVDFAKTAKLAFKTNSGYNNGEVLKVYWSNNYDPANPKAATLNDITSQFDISKGKIPAVSGASYEDSFRPSGTGGVPAGTKGSGFIIFEYNANSVNNVGVSSVMQLDDINIF